jgi:RNA polymerase sigma-70 factor (ECF subfamily)
MEDKTTDIIKLLKHQDKRAISLLYDKYGAALYGITLKIVQSEVLAEDVLQDSFVKVWKNAASFDEKKGTLFTWLLNITRNTALDTIKSAAFKRSKKIQALDFSVYDHEDWRVEQKPEHIGLRSAVDNLEEKYRLIIDLVYFKGYTQQEVVKHLDIPLGTVKSRVKIGLRELRKLFAESKVIIWIFFWWVASNLAG